MSDFDLTRPNRPDALGYFEDSQVDQQSKYVDAIQRLVSRLKDSAKGVRREDLRGKRRLRNKPQDASNTIRVYLKSLEIFTYWMRAKFGRELDPDEVTRRVAMELYEWMRSTDPPDIRGMIVRASGMDSWMIYSAVEKASRGGRQVNILEIYEMLTPATRAKFVPKKPDGTDDLSQLHKRLGMLIRDYRWMYRLPRSIEVRKEQGRIWTRKERDPMVYRYVVPEKRASIKMGSIATYLSGLSAIWSEMLKGDAGPHGEAPLRVNVWKEPARIALRGAREERKRAAREVMLTHPLRKSIFRAAAGPNLESLRDTLALYLLTHACLRSEELVGALRKDLYEKNGLLTLSIRSGKGDKTREIPLSSEIRDAMVAFDQGLRQRAQENEVNPETGELQPSHWARYCAALMTNPNAPIVPSLVRWGTNERDGQPEQTALEPLDTSGLRRMLYALAERARVVEVKSGMQRGLNADERKRIHAHNFRHYGATCAREAGMPLDEIQALLGHESIKTTEGYVHIQPDSVVIIGAYIAKAEKGDVMSTEEAQRMHRRRGSPLDDERIIASEPEGRKVPTPFVGQQPGEEQRPRRERIAVSDKPLKSPEWAYQTGVDKLRLYLPEVHMDPHDVPKGQGAVLTYRIGHTSRLPWWAGRKNTWAEQDMAPILSHFQTQPETEPNWDVLKGLQNLYKRFWNEKGPTAALALVAWITEITTVASKQFQSIMVKRGDKWIDFKASASPGELGIVREHMAERIVEWFAVHGDMAVQPLIRRPYNWIPFTERATRIDTRSFRVDDTEKNRVIFQPGREIKFMGVAKKKGEGVGRPDWRHATVGMYSGGMVAIRQEHRAKIDEGFLQAIEWADATTWGQMKETSYPALAAMRDLPKWFFDRDPLLSLPEEERAQMRKWIEQLQGIRPSVMRTTVAIDDLVNWLQVWGDYYHEFKFDTSARDTAKKQMAELDKKFQEETGKQDRFGAGVKIPPISIYEIVGKAADASFARIQQDIDAKMQEGMEQDEAIAEAREEHPTLEEPTEMMEEIDKEGRPRHAPLKYDERLTMYLKSKHGIDISAPGAVKPSRVLRARMFEEGYLTFNEQNTIVHDMRTKEEFWRRHGTDSECVLRRIARNLWERHKEAMGKRGPDAQEHHDMIRRHYYAWLAYIVPCPAAIEEELRRLHPADMAAHSAERMRDVIAEAWGQTVTQMLKDRGELAEEKVGDVEVARRLQMAVGKKAERYAEVETEFEESQEAHGGIPAGRSYEEQTSRAWQSKEEAKQETAKFKQPIVRRRAKPNFSETFTDELPDPVMLVFAEQWVT
ncbi:MAG: site-specific integrase [bacterium]